MSSQLPAPPDPTDADSLITQNQECPCHSAESQRRSTPYSMSPQRYYRRHNFPRSSMHPELRRKPRNPARRPHNQGHFSRRRAEVRLSNGSGSSGEQNATCVPNKPYPSEGSLLAQPANIPQMITPNSRENAVTEAMGGACDFTKSPLWLGKKLAAPATFSQKEPWLLQSQCNNFGSDTNSHTGSSASTTDRSRNGAMLSQTLQQNDGKIAHTVSIANPFAAVKDSDSLGPNQNQARTMTVGFGLAQSPTRVEMDEFSRFLQTIELHSQRYKDLADPASSYLEGDGRYANIKSVASDVNKFYTKPLRRQNWNSEGNLQVASLPGGGDSPDPPRDHRIPFNGHMIDRVDPGGPVVSVNGNPSGEEKGTKPDENLSQGGGSAVARDTRGQHNINSQSNYTPVNSSSCTYFAMPVHELPQGPAMGAADFGSVYDAFHQSAVSDDSLSKKRPRQDIGDRWQSKAEPSVDCCHQQSKAHLDKPHTAGDPQRNARCKECHPKRVKLDHFAGQSNLACQSCVDRQPFSSPLSSRSCGSHLTGTLSNLSQPFSKTFSAAVTPACQQRHVNADSALAVNWRGETLRLQYNNYQVHLYALSPFAGPPSKPQIRLLMK
ncbi:hypothetical protein AJ78_04896 [Emergomyces pasteurianus Ep9510]|uniref:Uncharacterized protein n=1 Tax=Emergomyces pasteurianus Ep9510 TaxID=1447872 RepID=A0A1J9PDX9_9EURO|nr:hypothetical protein AJ78_04896 [Emergomyces pasteurianus Ep9510]